jgi:uncharacterized membrane protein YheB (UPF0754 family)
VTLAIAWVQAWPEIRADFGANWWVYLSMPFVAAFVGYTTKLLFLQMLYKPLEFRGIWIIGWQGIVPRRAGKVAATTIELLTANLLNPEELLDRFDAKEALEELREPLTVMIDDLSREMADLVRPGLWDALPEAGRRAVQQRVQNQAPAMVEALLQEMRQDLSRYIDLQYLAVTTLVRNKAKLNDLMKAVSVRAMAFVRRSGIWFGFGIGLVQMVCWGYFHNPWLMPGFGFAVGFLSDWLALTMLFRPHQPKRYFGLFRHHGVLHAQRDQIMRDYSKILAEDLFAPDVMLDAVLHGPTADKLFDTVSREVSNAIDRQAGVAQPLVRLAIGTQRYRQVKDTIVRLVNERLPETMTLASDYTMRTLDIQNVIIDKMSQLTDEEYEAMMRPVFKDDEPLMIATGAVLGGLVGELQVIIIEHLSTH